MRSPALPFALPVVCDGSLGEQAVGPAAEWLACAQCPRMITTTVPRCRAPACLAAAMTFVPSRSGEQSQAPPHPMLLLLHILLLLRVLPHPPALPRHHRRAHPHVPTTPGLPLLICQQAQHHHRNVLWLARVAGTRMRPRCLCALCVAWTARSHRCARLTRVPCRERRYRAGTTAAPVRWAKARRGGCVCWRCLRACLERLHDRGTAAAGRQT